MKNFPHQYNDLQKLRATLETIRVLTAIDMDPSDDGVLGYELAQRRIYAFQGLDVTSSGDDIQALLAERIALEQAKPQGNQGARTAAREMRRTVRYLGWLEEHGNGLTPIGEQLLTSPEGSDDETILMQQGIGSIAVADNEASVSHPVQILLRLIDELEFRSRRGMELALEARDDSQVEFDRIAAIALMQDADRIEALKVLGWTDSQLANAVKILPAFALQSGLITTDGSGHFILTDAGRRVINRVGALPAIQNRTRPLRSRRARRGTSTSTNNKSAVGRSPRQLGGDRRILTREEQELAAELLYERTERHQELLRNFAAQCGPANFYEDLASYDLVVDREAREPIDLAEMKTVAGDAQAQVRRAVGQLLFYQHFQVAAEFPDRAVRLVVVVDDAIDDDLAAFLSHLDIGLIMRLDSEFLSGNELGSAVMNDLFNSTG